MQYVIQVNFRYGVENVVFTVWQGVLRLQGENVAVFDQAGFREVLPL